MSEIGRVKKITVADPFPFSKVKHEVWEVITQATYSIMGGARAIVLSPNTGAVFAIAVDTEGYKQLPQRFWAAVGEDYLNFIPVSENGQEPKNKDTVRLRKW